MPTDRGADNRTPTDSDDEVGRAAPPCYNITINVTGSTIAQLNNAVEAVHTIESRLNAIGNRGSSDLADSLSEITQAIVGEETLSVERRAHLLGDAERM